MHKNRPFLFTLLILLVLDLLVFFTDVPSSKNRETASFEQETEEVFEGLYEAVEELEEESEFLCSGLLFNKHIQIDFLSSYSKRLFHAPKAQATPLACGWRMPLLI